ncbi:MAG TPA: cytotoxic translational repressor of toxin-antitoxin stability system [Opitutales bacterium]|nr:cytotoxic translational repressor of toxin-antitoxin stability system [Opitutales bacterium]
MSRDEMMDEGRKGLDAMREQTAAKMYQVTFSDQSMGELNKMTIHEQMKIVEIISHITPEMLAHPHEPLGRFTREGRTFFRVRTDDLRCYFEVKDNALFSHYIIRKHTLTDFVFRFKLPVTEEQIIEQNGSFWKYLDTLTK